MEFLSFLLSTFLLAFPSDATISAPKIRKHKDAVLVTLASGADEDLCFSAPPQRCNSNIGFGQSMTRSQECSGRTIYGNRRPDHPSMTASQPDIATLPFLDVLVSDGLDQDTGQSTTGWTCDQSQFELTADHHLLTAANGVRRTQPQPHRRGPSHPP